MKRLPATPGVRRCRSAVPIVCALLILGACSDAGTGSERSTPGPDPAPAGNSVTGSTPTTHVDDGPGLAGTVDSRYVDDGGLNKVYIYAGDVTPDDYDGDAGDPVFSAAVGQDPGGCTWRYRLAAALQDGLYTVAFTAEAGVDKPDSDESLTFSGSEALRVSGGVAVHDFVPANVIRVGPTRPHTTLAEASRVAVSGDVVEIDAGTYQDDISVWRQDDLVLRGVNGRPRLQAIALIAYAGGSDRKNGKGIMVIKGDNVRVENLEFSGARVPDSNGAGIRAEGGALTICNGYFHNNEMGVLGFGSKIVIEHSEFDNNGLSRTGLSHNIYINRAERFVFRNSYSHHAVIGHNLKSRAGENFILYSRLMDEADGRSSYAIDLPNGGLSYVIGNLIQQGRQGDNPTMLYYGAEGLAPGGAHRLYVVNNSFVNDRRSGTFVRINPATEAAQVVNNLFVGKGTPVNGPARQRGNLQTRAPGFADIDNYDYRLTAGSMAIDAGVDPGSAEGHSLAPIEHYVHKTRQEPRIRSGSIDVGAYEYTP